MKRYTCPNSECSHHKAGPHFKPPIRIGHFTRTSDGQRIQRYRCRKCKRNFSSATFSKCFGQKKRKVNHLILKLLCSGVSQRRVALILNLNRKTVVFKFRFLAKQARIENHKDIDNLYSQTSVENGVKISWVQFDDLETVEHSKCKPISVALAVQPESRKILAFQASRMPAKGPLSKFALKKYGVRKDDRSTGWTNLFESLKCIVAQSAEFTSDQNPFYPKHLKESFPKATHIQVKGRRGCIAGQGELKKVGFDPLFSLNHTCAMLRANINRLFRKTWCTSKTLNGLLDHLSIYVFFHNRFLTPPYSL